MSGRVFFHAENVRKEFSVETEIASDCTVRCDENLISIFMGG